MTDAASISPLAAALLSAAALGCSVWLHVLDRYPGGPRLRRLRREEKRRRSPIVVWAGACGVLCGVCGLGWWQLPLLLAAAWRMPALLAAQRQARRTASLRGELPMLWLLFGVCHRAGLSLQQCIELLATGVSGEAGRCLCVARDEFAAGRNAVVALRAAADAAGEPALARGFRLVLRADTLGAPLTAVLQRLSQQAVLEQRWEREARLNRLPLWLAVVTVCCFLPAVLTVAVLPHVLGFLEQLR